MGAMKDIAIQLEGLRERLRAGDISYGELAELQSLAEFIDPSDVELLEPAGVPEHPVRIKIVNTYSDHSSEHVVIVAEPDAMELDEWWDKQVFPHTGDGSGGNAIYTATVIETNYVGLTGVTHEWSD